MKKILCVILCILFIFTPVGCSEEKEDYRDHDIIVYVSRYGKFHSHPNCSGMIYYKTMTLYDAINEGNVVCKKCENDIKEALEDYYNYNENYNYYDNRYYEDPEYWYRDAYD